MVQSCSNVPGAEFHGSSKWVSERLVDAQGRIVVLGKEPQVRWDAEGLHWSVTMFRHWPIQERKATRIVSKPVVSIVLVTPRENVVAVGQADSPR